MNSPTMLATEPPEVAPASRPIPRRGRAGDGRLHEVIVVGGGAAGLELATKLGDTLGKRGQARITLVEKSRTHIWKPLLHAIAAGGMRRSQHELNYLAQARWHHFTCRLGALSGLDRERREIRIAATTDDEGREVTPPRTFPYDTLVVAVGSVTNDFGTPGAAQFAVPLETAEQATRFNKRMVNACLRANAQPEPVRPGQLHVAIIGAGATGTELAAELHRTVREVVAYGMTRLDPERDVKIILIEAAPRILPALPERMSASTTELLEGLNVQVRTNAKVAEVRADGVVLADGEFIPSELVVWSAGVKGPDFLRDLGLEVNRINQLVVEQTLQTTWDENVFAIGDCLRLPARGFSAGRAAARAGGAPDGGAHGRTGEFAAGRSAAEAVLLPRFRLAGLARALQHRGQPDGLRNWSRIVHRGVFRAHDVSLAIRDAPGGTARQPLGPVAAPCGQPAAPP